MRLDRAALAGTVAALEHDADLEALLHDPLLQLHELDVQLPQLLVVVLAGDLAVPDRCGLVFLLASAVTLVLLRLALRGAFVLAICISVESLRRARSFAKVGSRAHCNFAAAPLLHRQVGRRSVHAGSSTAGQDRWFVDGSSRQDRCGS
jgi:hypothetical protein